MPPPAPPRRVYLDHAAATPLCDEVAEAMREAAATAFANPSSPHAAGRAAKRILEDARETIMHLVGGRTSGPARDRLVFTSGATEANRLGILGLAGAATATAGSGWIGISSRDHGSIRQAARELAGRGWTMVDVPLSPAGSAAGDALAGALGDAPPEAGRILAVTTVCGQTGIREDQRLLAALSASSPGLRVHADATQAAAWDDLAFAASPWASLALAPHKFGGPRGIGGLVLRGGVTLEPTMPGPQELGLRGGTEAVTLAAGFARALELAVADRAAVGARVAALRRRLEAGVAAAARTAGFEAIVVGDGGSRAPHVALVAIANLDRQAVAMAADIDGVCLATGTACASGSSEPPAMFAELGLPPRFHQGGLRLSLGPGTTAAEIEAAVETLAGVFGRLGGRATSVG
jgi:cysteine desulfurase